MDNDIMQVQEQAEDEELIILTIPEAARLLGISRGLGYRLARSGEIPTLRVGQRLVVPRAALLALVGDAPEAE